MPNFEQWEGFAGKNWRNSVDVRDFIQENYTPYEGDESFLEGPTEATDKLWGRLQELQKEERAKGGVLDMETEVVSGLTAYGPGYIDDSMKSGAGCRTSDRQTAEKSIYALRRYQHGCKSLYNLRL